MPKEVRTLFLQSAKTTLVLCIVCSAIGCFLVPADQWVKMALSLLVGAGTAFLSLYMIWNSARSLDPNAAPKRSAGVYAYIVRYLMNALVLGAGAWAGLPIVGMLVGVIAQKAGLVWYARSGRKEIQ